MKASPKAYPQYCVGTKSPSHLILRNGTWHFRMIIPKECRPLLGELKEFKVSLLTGRLKEARVKATKLASNAHEIYDRVQANYYLMKKLEKDKIRSLARQWLVNGLDVYETDHLSRHKSMTPVEQETRANDLATLIKFYQQRLACGDYSAISHDWITAMLDREGLPIPEKDSMDYRMVVAEFMKSAVELSKIQTNRTKGDYSDSPLLNNVSGFHLNGQAGSHQAALQPEIDSAKVSETLEAYIQEKIRTGAWSNRTYIDFKAILDFLKEYLGEMQVHEINRDLLRGFKKIVDSLPARFKSIQTYKKLSIQQISTLDIPLDKRLSISSLSKYYGVINSYLIWLNHKYDHVDPGLTGVLRIKVGHQVDQLRNIFESKDLDKIFRSDLFKKDTKNPWKYWLPLLGLYTGMRLEEICQLHVKDIIVEDGINCIDINASEDKNLKTAAAVRIIPIHPVLVSKLGFTDFVEKQKKGGFERLFPDLKKISGRYSHYPSRWFNSIFLVKAGVKTEGSKKTFHSFRHTFANACKIADVEEYKSRQFLGHDVSGKSITYGRYGKKYPVKVLLNDILNKIDLYKGFQG